MFYVLERDPSIKIVGTVRDTDTAMVSRFVLGGLIDPSQAPSSVTVEVEKAPEEYPDYFQLQQIPVVSAPVLTALQSVGVDNIASYPAPIVEDSRTVEGHSVLHIVGRVAALDAANSTVTSLSGHVVRIRKLALVKGLTTDLHIFRLKEQPFVIIVSKKVHGALRGFSGLILSPAEGWSDERQFKGR